MRKLVFAIIISCFIQGIYGQSNEKRVWTTILHEDSISTEKFLSQYEYDIRNVHYRFSFNPNGDTTETVINYFDINGKDSIEIWKWSDDDYFEKHWIYINDQLEQELTFLNGAGTNATIFYQYNSDGNMIKRIRLFETFQSFDTLIYQNNFLHEILSYSQEEISEIEKYKYNRNHLPVRITTYNAQKEKRRRIKIKYDSDSKKVEVKVIEYKPFSKTKKTVELKTFKYSKSGILREFIFKDFESQYTRINFYDEKGNWIKSIGVDNKFGRKRIFEPE
ncbi:MAG: hypothetical protein KG029_15925 [Bacteroidetes bacterium]|jgi:hypothetical protein|nr:hypothetical protein [Bacteroidota bacterium]